MGPGHGHRYHRVLQTGHDHRALGLTQAQDTLIQLQLIVVDTIFSSEPPPAHCLQPLPGITNHASTIVDRNTNHTS